VRHCYAASLESLPCRARPAAPAPAAQAGRVRRQASARLQHDGPVRGQARERGQAAARGRNDRGRARAVAQAPREAGRAAGAGGRQVRQLAGRRGRRQRVHQACRCVAHALGVACGGQRSQPRSCARGSTPAAAAAGVCCALASRRAQRDRRAAAPVATPSRLHAWRAHWRGHPCPETPPVGRLLRSASMERGHASCLGAW